MTRVTYIPSVQSAAENMCKLLARATPVIARLYPTNAALQAALAAANAACEELAIQAAQERDYETS